jgi:hypothetical protein
LASGLWAPNFRSRRLGLEDAVFVQVRPIPIERFEPVDPLKNPHAIGWLAGELGEIETKMN